LEDLFVIWREHHAVETVFAPLTGRFTHWNLPAAFGPADRINVRANWKLIFENIPVLSLSLCISAVELTP
jgi:hypothetical protein